MSCGVDRLRVLRFDAGLHFAFFSVAARTKIDDAKEGQS